jgi:hypothetical protein
MIIAGIYSFKNGREIVEHNYPEQLQEVRRVISSIRVEEHRTKVSKEKTMPGKMLYNPRSLNKAIKHEFMGLGWETHRVPCEYPPDYYVEGYDPNGQTINAFREIDFVKDRLGIEVQFGKYAFMVYNVCAKMTIFHNLGIIDAGVEIVPVKAFANNMSTGVSYFEQFVWDLNQRGVADIDIPVLILGIAGD